MNNLRIQSIRIYKKRYDFSKVDFVGVDVRGERKILMAHLWPSSRMQATPRRPACYLISPGREAAKKCVAAAKRCGAVKRKRAPSNNFALVIETRPIRRRWGTTPHRFPKVKGILNKEGLQIRFFVFVCFCLPHPWYIWADYSTIPSDPVSGKTESGKRQGISLSGKNVDIWLKILTFFKRK